MTFVAAPRRQESGKSRRDVLLAGLLASVFATLPLSAFAQGAAAGDEPDLSGVRLVIGVQNSGSTAFRSILDASGAFEDTPYELEWAEFNGAAGAVEALQAGAIDLDVGLNFATPVLVQANASRPWTEEDRPFVIVGANFLHNRGGTTIVVHPDSGIDTISDLEGRSITFARGTAGHYFFLVAAEDAGLDPEAVEVIPMTLTEARAAFIGRSVDSLATSLSNARPLVTSGDGEILATSEGLYDTYNWFVARPEILADPAGEAATADVLRRLQEAALWHADNLETVEEIFVRETGQSPEDAVFAAQEGVSSYVPITPEVVAANQQQGDVFYAAGVAQSEIDAAVAFDDRYNDIVGQAAP